MWFLVAIALTVSGQPQVVSFRPQPDLPVCLERQEVMQRGMNKRVGKSVIVVRCLRINPFKEPTPKKKTQGTLRDKLSAEVKSY